MDTKQILKLLEPRNQNLPSLDFERNLKGCDMVVVPVFEGEESVAKKTHPVPLFTKLNGKKDEKIRLVKNNQIYWFVGIGSRKDVTSRAMRRFFGTWYSASVASKPKRIGFDCPLGWLKEAAIGIHVGALNAGILKSKSKKDSAPKVIFLKKSFENRMSEAKDALKLGKAIAEGKNLMRILGALPPNILHTQAYADVIEALAEKWSVECKRLTEKEREPYQLLNAVSAGSDHHSELLVLTLHPKAGPTKHSVAVIGKGLCFDAGGVQDKQSYMKGMKEDMAGSASVLGTLHAIKKEGMDLKETTHFVLGLAENKMGERAMRPDDIYTTGDGQTVEVMHTDAEGRLVLADVICYMKKNYKNIHQFFTIATLTGSCVQALGDLYTGMIVNNEGLSKEVERAGFLTGDLVHAAPWDVEYDDNNSPNCDVAGFGESRDAGWIRVGFFLYKFVPKAKKPEDQAGFCHLDIAGSIDMKDAGKPWRAKGLNSGIGVGLFTKLLTK